MPEQTLEQPLPWHEPAWKQLQNAVSNDRLPHALLLTGPANIGKALFSGYLAALLLCEQPDWEKPTPCNRCASCLKRAQGAHPDLRHIRPQEGKKNILIDDIRDMMNFMQLSAHVHKGHKIVIINPAERLNRNAANALLKTLEEPPANRLLILITDSPSQLPATIRSRCQLLRFNSCPNDLKTTWLNAVTSGKFTADALDIEYHSPLTALTAWQNVQKGEGNEPQPWAAQWLKAVTEHKSTLEIAQIWSELDEVTDLINCLNSELLNSLRNLNSSGGAPGSMFQKAGLKGEDLLFIQNKINMIRVSVDTTLNKRLIWETFLLSCRQMVEQKKAA